MSRRLRTTLTIQVRLPLPPGANTAMATEFVREAIKAASSLKVWTGNNSHPMASLQTAEMIVKLERKDTTYL